MLVGLVELLILIGCGLHAKFDEYQSVLMTLRRGRGIGISPWCTWGAASATYAYKFASDPSVNQ